MATVATEKEQASEMFNKVKDSIVGKENMKSMDEMPMGNMGM